MIQAPGQIGIALMGHSPKLALRVDVGPWDRVHPSTGEIVPYRDVPDIEHDFPAYPPNDPDDNYPRTVDQCVELSDRVVGIGAINHKIPFLLDSAEASRLTLSFDNSDNALSQLLHGSVASNQPHWWMVNNRHIGRLLRVQLGVQDRDHGFHFMPGYEGIIQSADQRGRTVSVSCLDPMSYLHRIRITSNDTFSSKSAPEIIQDLFDSYTSEADTIARPIIDAESFQSGIDNAPFLLSVTGSGDSVVQGLSLAEAFTKLAMHNFGTVWIDGRRRLRYSMREIVGTEPSMILDWDLNIIEASLAQDVASVVNRIYVKWGASLTQVGPYENDESQRRYGISPAPNGTTVELPYLTSSGDGEAWGRRLLAELQWPPITFKATTSMEAMLLEVGDWALVRHRGIGINGLRFQAFETDFDPGSRLVHLTCHNTEPRVTEGGVFQWGISKFNSSDRFQ